MKTRTVSALPIALVAAAATLIPIAANAQQQPIYGCRQSINCRPSPTSNSALNDPGVGGLLVQSRLHVGPQFHFGLVTPQLRLPLLGDDPPVDRKAFRLRNATLVPPSAEAET